MFVSAQEATLELAIARGRANPATSQLHPKVWAMPFKSFPRVGTATLFLALGGWPSALRAVTTNWNNVTSGFLGDPANWDNGVPHAADTAVFREGIGATYTVSFLGGDPLMGVTTHYQTDRLVVGNNDV